MDRVEDRVEASPLPPSPIADAGSAAAPHSGDAREQVHLVCELTEDLAFAYASPGFDRDLGWELEDLAGAKLERFIHPDDWPRLFALLEPRRDPERPRLFGVAARIRDARSRWRDCSWRAHRYVGKSGGCRIALWAVDRYEPWIQDTIVGELIEKARDALVVFDSDGRIQIFNPRAEALLGYTQSEVSERTFELFMPERLRSRREQLWQRFVLEGEGRRSSRPTRVVARRKDGSEVELAVYVSRVGNDAAPLVIACLRDVESELAVEQRRKLLASQRTQARRYEILGKITNGIAHDSNNLLGAIVNLTNLALDAIETASPARAYLQDVKRATFRIAELCKRLMTFTGRKESGLEPVDLSSEVGAMRRLVEASVARTTELRFELAAQPLPILADLTQLHQLLLNLVVNAAESLSGAAGRIVVRTGLEPLDDVRCEDALVVDEMPDGPCVFLEVSDTGRGIDETTRERIFEPFFSTKQDPGHGLGMAVVLEIVRAHGASIQIRSRAGHGSAVTIFFPLSEVKTVRAIPNRMGSSPWSGSSRGTILLVDDEDVLRTTTKRLLMAAGYTVVTAADGLEAVAAFEVDPGRFDLVILDLAMPRLNGWQAHQQMRSIRPEAKVLFVSGWPEAIARMELAEDAPADFIQKPYEVAALLRRVEEVIASRA
ncbi:MAG: PAS domain S-box protein [Myxococcota bacterium]